MSILWKLIRYALYKFHHTLWYTRTSTVVLIHSITFFSKLRMSEWFNWLPGVDESCRSVRSNIAQRDCNVSLEQSNIDILGLQERRWLMCISANRRRWNRNLQSSELRRHLGVYLEDMSGVATCKMKCYCY